MVYFAQQGKDGPIKIGYSNNVKRRLHTLTTGSSERLTLLGTMPGDRYVEAELHARFSHLRVKGEWFKPGSEIFEFLKIEKPEDNANKTAHLRVRLTSEEKSDIEKHATNNGLPVSQYLRRVLKLAGVLVALVFVGGCIGSPITPIDMDSTAPTGFGTPCVASTDCSSFAADRPPGFLGCASYLGVGADYCTMPCGVSANGASCWQGSTCECVLRTNASDIIETDCFCALLL